MCVVVGPAVLTRHRAVCSAQVAAQRRLKDPAGAEGAVLLSGDPEGQHLWVDLPAASIAVLRAPEGAAVRRGGGDEVVQEEVEGKDGTGQAQDDQEKKLKLTEAPNIIQDFLEPHSDETEADVLLLL